MVVRYLIVFLPFLISCGRGVSPSAFSDNASFGDTSEKVCYRDDNESCFSLKLIQPVNFGYQKPDGVDPVQYREPIRAIKLDEVDLNSQISENFKAFEFMSPQKGAIGIFSPRVVRHLQAIRDFIQQALNVNSGYRPPNYNDDIPGAAKWSRHMYGDAADIAASGIDVAILAQRCRDQGATFTQLYENHVHCDWRGETLAEEFYGLEPIGPAREEILADLRDKSEIVIDGTQSAGRRIVVTSFQKDQEDPNEKLLRQWWITFPNGVSEYLEQAEVHINLISGEYRIRHVLGGNIYLEKTIEVP